MKHLPYKRTDRVRTTIKKELSSILYKKIKNPIIGFITITDVNITKDLRYVNAFISVYGDERSQQKTIAILNKAAPFVRREISSRIHIKHIPQIKFSLDNSVAYADKMSKLLDEINGNKKSC